MTTEQPQTISAPPADDVGWLPISSRTVLANIALLAFHFGGPIFFTAFIFAVVTDPWLGLGIVLLTLAGLAVFAAFDWVHTRRTRYRVTEERFELQSGIIARSYRSIPRDRIRSVDITANIMNRILGVATLVVGTGQHQNEDALKLEYVSAAVAEQLRRELLRHGAAPAVTDQEETGADTVLATMNWAWLRYAPLTVWAPALGIGVLGGLYELLSWLGEDLVNDNIQRLFWIVVGFGLIGIAGVVVGILLVGTISTLAFVVESWWGYRLEREDNKTLLLRRGLLNQKSLSLDEQRLRGVEIAEPLLLRLAKAASVNVIATGLVKTSEEKQVEMSALTPDVPIAEAHRIARTVLRERAMPTETTPLVAHPLAARRRRLRWAFMLSVPIVAIVLVAALLIAWIPDWVWLPTLVVVPIAVLYALDAYRNLGHGYDGKYLLIRSGTFVRRTVVLRQGAVIGWTIQQSPFQRRTGLATFTATTAAGNGSYHVQDADPGAGIAFAEATVPGLLAPFTVASDDHKP